MTQLTERETQHVIKRLLTALAFLVTLLLVPSTATTANAAVGVSARDASSAEYRSVTRNKFGRQVTWWFTRVSPDSGPKKWIPSSVRMCGGSGEYGYPLFQGKGTDGYLKYGSTFIGDYATDGCSWWDVDPTTQSNIGFYSNGIPRAEIGLYVDQDGDGQPDSYFYWAVDGSTGQLAAYERPAPGGHLDTMNYVLLP